MVFLLISDTLWDLFFMQKLEKTEFGDDSKRTWNKGPKKIWFLRGWNLEKWAPVQAGAWFWGFVQLQENAQFWRCFGTSF